GTGFPNAGMHRQSEMVFDYINQHPQFLTPETHFRQGVLLMRMGQHTKAKEILELALAEQKRLEQKRPEGPVPYRVSGQVLTLLGRQQEAKAAFLEAIEKDRALFERASDAGAEARIRWSLTKTLIASGDYEAASQQLSRARALASPRIRYSTDRWMQRNLSKEDLEKLRSFLN
ncbi:MAG: tetratricopeptide repeat protein, partial [Candidatus Binatia bacterium]